MNAATNSIKVLGITDETSVCECCGKTNLKRVVVLQLADGLIVRYGRDCAARKLGKTVAKQVDSFIEINSYITKWATKYSGEIIAQGIWNKLGYLCEYRNGQYHIGGIGIIQTT